jgi:cytidylate kinase
MSNRARSAPVVVVVTGLPGAGKSTVGRRIADHFNLPFITKDTFKELIFDGLGWSDKAWSLKVSATTHRIMDYVIAEECKARQSVVVESNFKPAVDSVRFRDLTERFGAALVQVLCWASGDVLFERYKHRLEVDRHPGHVEDGSLDQARRDLLRGKCEPLRIDGPTLELETTDFDLLDYPALMEWLASLSLE